MDYHHPGSKKITLALTRLAAGNPATRIGVLLVNPGGPGGSGLNLAHRAATAFPDEVRLKFDIIGWDPRGVGQSSPVVCQDATAPPTPTITATPTQSSLIDAAVARMAAYGEACLRNTGDELGFVDTVSSARDIDRIRVALREDVISYIGYSYGTLLGATYADLYPSHVRAFVLDAAVDPALTYEAKYEGITVAVEAALQAFLSDCAVHTDCPYYSSGDPQGHFEKLRQVLDADPVLATATSGISTKIDGNGLIKAVFQGLMSGGWTTLAQALADVELRRDGTRIAEFLRGAGGATAGNAADAEIAINCLDIPTPNRDALSQLASRLTVEAPDFASPPPQLAECDGWPLGATGLPHELHALGSAPILVVGTTGDPNTPYKWSQSLARQLSSGHLLTWQGHEHTVSFHARGRSSCIDTAVIAYLVDLTVPEDGKICN